MAAAAHNAGLTEVVVDERCVGVGITEPEQLVDYRFGQAHFTGWLDCLTPIKRETCTAKLPTRSAQP